MHHTWMNVSCCPFWCRLFESVSWGFLSPEWFPYIHLMNYPFYFLKSDLAGANFFFFILKLMNALWSRVLLSLLVLLVSLHTPGFCSMCSGQLPLYFFPTAAIASIFHYTASGRKNCFLINIWAENGFSVEQNYQSSTRLVYIMACYFLSPF